MCVGGRERETTCVMDGAVRGRRREREHPCTFWGHDVCRLAVALSHVVCRHSDTTDLEAIDEGMSDGKKASPGKLGCLTASWGVSRLGFRWVHG